MPCWTSSKVSTHEENEPPQGKVNRFRGKTRHFPPKKGMCAHGKVWKYEEKCYKKDCNENLK